MNRTLLLSLLLSFHSLYFLTTVKAETTKELNTPQKESSISKKNNINLVKADDKTIPKFEEKKIAINAGIGITYPLGPIGKPDDNAPVDFNLAIPMLISFQFVVSKNFTLEVDWFYYMLINGIDTSYDNKEVNDFKVLQLGICGRLWPLKSQGKQSILKNIYLGIGLARTNVEIEIEGKGLIDYVLFYRSFGSIALTTTTDIDYTTIILKGGYVFQITDTLLMDFGVRYDAIDIGNWNDQPITFYSMACFAY